MAVGAEAVTTSQHAEHFRAGSGSAVTLGPYLSTRPYQICTRCVMDTSDPEIVFDEYGECNHCKHFAQNVSTRVLHGEHGRAELDAIVQTMKRDGMGKRYDCIVGVSGGVDSTYVAYQAQRMGLRPLAVHFDNGWNSELAVSNIEKTLQRLGIDLFTYVVDWNEFRDLQLAFLKASTPDSEVPTDHAIFALLIDVALKQKVNYVLSGTNFNTEGIYIQEWGYGHNDWRYIQNIQRRFGRVPLKSFPRYGLFRLFYALMVRRIRFVSPLNYLPYDKQQAMRVLEEDLGWKYYGGKHHESIYTRFFQSYILPVKFGIDKRRSHLSTLIYSSGGEFTREMALRELEGDICAPELVREDKEFTVKKLGLTEAEFDAIMALPVRSFHEFPSNYRWVKLLRKVQLKLRELGILYR